MSSIDDIQIRADKPERFVFSQLASLVISFIALAVSVASMVQSRKNSTLQNELARPLLEASADAKMAELQSGDKWVFDVLLTVKNAGHLTAFVTDVVARPGLLFFEDSPDSACIRELDAVAAKAQYGEKEIPPEHENWFSLDLPIPKSCMKFHEGFPITVTFTYHDRINQNGYRQAVQMRSILASPTH